MSLNLLNFLMFPCSMIRLIVAACPPGCTCANTLVQCSCATMADNAMTLSTFRHIDFLSKIYIYNCRNLTVPAETFSGLALSHELSIRGIQHLRIHSFAFRGLVKYPEIFSITDCGIPLLPVDSFAGFHRVRHIWFKNVNVSNIQYGAFRHVRDIEYVYVRESNLGRIETHAFSNMINITHFFIRGRSKMDRIDSNIFHSSIFKKIIFEDVRIHSMSAFAFNGPSYYDELLFDMVNVDNMDFSNPNLESDNNSSSGRKIHFRQCRFQCRVPLASCFSGVLEVKFENSFIHRLSPISTNAISNMSRLWFLRSTIHTIESRAFYGWNRVNTILFQESTINVISDRSFAAGSSIKECHFLKSNISHLATHAFENAVISRIAINACRIHTIETRAFSNMKIDQLLITYSSINILQAKPFAQIQAHRFIIDNVNINRVHDYAFNSVSTNELTIRGCDFPPDMRENWLSGVSFSQLMISGNRFYCSRQDCRFLSDFASLTARASFFLPSYISISDNVCIDAAAGDVMNLEDYNARFCATMDAKIRLASSGLTCTKDTMLMICSCSRVNQTTVIDAGVITELSILSEASILIISYCPSLRFAEAAMSGGCLSHLIIKNSQSVELEANFMRNFRCRVSSVQISNAGMIHLHKNAFSSLHFSPPRRPPDIEIFNSTVPQLSNGMFEESNIRRLAFRKCIIGSVEPLFARKSRIDELRIDNSAVGRLRRWALNETEIGELHIHGSRIYQIDKHFAPRTMMKQAFVCFEGNRFSCNCYQEGVEMLFTRNGCNGDGNQCIDQDYLQQQWRETDLFTSIGSRFHLHEINETYIDNCNGHISSVEEDHLRDTAELLHFTAASSLAVRTHCLMFAATYLLFCLAFM